MPDPIRVTRAELREFAEAVASLHHPDDGCILWPGSVTDRGYGKVWVDGRYVGAHRYVLSRATGRTPHNLVAAHSCRQPACVNPSHLRWATQAENMADKKRDGTEQKGETHPHSKLTPTQVRAIRSDHRSQRTVAKSHGVSRSTICDILAGRTWGWLP